MIQTTLANLRTAQSSWQARPVPGRIKVLRAVRREIAGRAAEFMDAVQLPGRRVPVETLPLEILPLLDGIKYLERNAERILKIRKLGMRGRPLWLSGVKAEIRRDPYGVVLVIAPFNYPLFLPGIQAIQALAAGNSVAVKPSPGHSAPMRLLGKCLEQAGLPADLFVVLDETVEAAEQTIDAGVDKIVMTGSVGAGRAVLRRAANSVTPCVAELSGNDPVFVLPDADLEIVANALAYGLQLNGGATCIAPRRVYAQAKELRVIENRLCSMLNSMAACRVGESAAAQIERLLGEARMAGCTVHGGAQAGDMVLPAIVVDPDPSSGLLHEDIFAPVMSLVTVTSPEEALSLACRSPYRLAASVFGAPGAARAVADLITAGAVVVNDLIVPTADPRLPFEGRGLSGYGPTRGAEGLLSMTQARTVSERRNRLYLHFRPLMTEDSRLFLALIELVHGKGVWRILPGR